MTDRSAGDTAGPAARTTVSEPPDSARSPDATSLSLAGQALTEIPVALLETAGTLRELDLSHNQIERLPEWIGRFAGLRVLNLSANRLTMLPGTVRDLLRLTDLDLSDNRLVELPLELGGLHRLTRLELSGNRHLIVPPPQIAAQGVDQALAFLRGVSGAPTSRTGRAPDRTSSPGSRAISPPDPAAGGTPDRVGKALELPRAGAAAEPGLFASSADKTWPRLWRPVTAEPAATVNQKLTSAAPGPIRGWLGRGAAAVVSRVRPGAAVKAAADGQSASALWPLRSAPESGLAEPPTDPSLFETQILKRSQVVFTATPAARAADATAPAEKPTTKPAGPRTTAPARSSGSRLFTKAKAKANSISAAVVPTRIRRRRPRDLVTIAVILASLTAVAVLLFAAGGSPARASKTAVAGASPQPARNAAAPEPTNVDFARGRGATASSHAPGYVPGNADDGNLRTYWESAPNAFPQQLYVKLAAPETIAKMVLSLPPDADWDSRTQTIVVDGSLNGGPAFTVHGEARYTFNAANGDAVTVTFPGVRVDTIELDFLANSGWYAAQLSEIAIYG
jgi:hypothetical protein